MKRVKPIRRARTFVLIAFMIFAAVLGALFLNKFESRRLKPAAPTHPPQMGSRVITLFFAAPDGRGLVREGRKVDACADPVQCIETLLGELINGPVGDLTPTLPPNLMVRSVQVEGKVARIDLGREMLEGLPHGSASEMAAIYSIVNTIAFNVPQVNQVSFLIDGSGVDTLLGHLDLRQPLPPDFTLEKKE
jgi:spore germination protein GerM